MSTSRDPEKPRKAADPAPRTGSAKGHKTPLTRRLKYLLQDTRYAVKKAGRRAADPLRDARPGAKPARGESSRRRTKPGPKRAPKPAAERAPDSTSERGRAATPGARELGERPADPAKEPADRPQRPTGLKRRAERRKPPAGRRKPRLVRPRRRIGGLNRPVARPKRRARRARLRRPKVSAAGVASAITGFGERSSRLIRGALAPITLPLLGLASLGRGALRRLAAALTPLRAALAVTALAAILLGVSQFVDYRGVAVGVSDYAAYSDAELVAPAPQVDRQPAGSAHAYLLVPVAILALALLFFSVRGRWQLGRVVSLLGVLAVAISLIVDVPAGLDEGAQAVAYAGVEARLIEGFYVQLVSAAVLVVGGLLVSHYARRSRRQPSRRKRRAAAVGPARARAA